MIERVYRTFKMIEKHTYLHLQNARFGMLQLDLRMSLKDISSI